MKYKFGKRMIALMIAISLVTEIFSMPLSQTIWADEAEQETNIVINPLYQDIIDPKKAREEIEEASLVEDGMVFFGVETKCNTVEEAGAYVRQQMVARQENLSFLIDMDIYDSLGLNNLVNDVFTEAIEHTEELLPGMDRVHRLMMIIS